MAYEELCVCGHRLRDHHLSWLPGGYMLKEECEFWNEETKYCKCERFKEVE